MAQQVPLLRARTRFNEILRKHLNRVPNDSQRVVSINRGDLASGSESHNIISNHKYSWWTFLPMMIYEQFSAPMNLFFLVIATLQLWRAISPVHPITTWTPLLVVFFVSSYKALSDDMARRRADAVANSRQYEVWRQGKVWTGQGQGAEGAAGPTASSGLCAAQDIAVGDLVRVRDDEEVPCDLLLVKTADIVPDGCAYVETANLDGETDLKVRRARCETQMLSLEQISALRGRVHCEPPNADLYRLDAKLVIVGSRQAQQGDGAGDGFTTPKPTLGGLPIGLALSAAAARVGLLSTEPKRGSQVPRNSAAGGRARQDEEEEIDVEDGQRARSDLSALVPTVVRQRAGQAGIFRPSPTASPDPSTGPLALGLAVTSSGRPGGDGTLDLPMGGDQLLQHGTVVRRSGWVLGIALYTGVDTKLNQNKAVPPRKVAGIDREINKYVVAVFTVQALLVLTLGLMGASWSGNGNSAYWYLGWPREIVGGDGDVTDVETTADALQGLQHGPGSGPTAMAGALDGGDTATGGDVSNSTDAGGEGDASLGSLIADVWSESSPSAASRVGPGDTAEDASRVLAAVGKGARLLAAAMLRQPLPSPAAGLAIQPGPRLGSSSGHHHAWWAGFVLPLRFLLLSSMMIPISLKVTMDLAKAFHAWLITQDVDMWDEEKDTPAGVANTGISEDLGRVGVVLTDKTGTLTENIMRLCAVSVAGRLHGWHPGLAEGTSCTPFPPCPTDAPMLDMLQALALCNTVTPEHVNAVLLTPAEVKEARSTGRARSGSVGISPDGQGFVRFVPDTEKEEGSDSVGGGVGGGMGATVEGKGRRLSIVPQQRKRCLQYASSSPDEEALVLGAARLGVSLAMRRTVGSSAAAVGVASVPYSTPPVPTSAPAAGRATAQTASTEKLVLSFGTPQVTKRSFTMDASQADSSAGVVGEERQVWVHDDWAEHSWEVLATLPFDSDRKRMSVLVRRVGVPATLPYPTPSSSVFSASDAHQLFLICKGADEVLWPRVERAAGGRGDVMRATQEQLDACAAHGLRTLLVTARPVSAPEYHGWRAAWDKAQGEVGKGRAEALSKVMDSIEHGLQLLGATAIEDKLQAGVPEAISDLREAGVRFWMVTGDKHSTAVQIAKAASLIHSNTTLQPLLLDLHGKNAEDVRAELRAAAFRVQHMQSEEKALYRHRAPALPSAGAAGGAGGEAAGGPGHREVVVIVQGQALRHILAHADLCKAFVELALPASAVIACRCTPAQKAGLVRAVRVLGGQVTLAIGDGGNDVSMIQAADIGVGISGREGQQAARAADYSLARFSYLKKLLLVHGRYSHYRTSVAAQYCFYKSQAIALTQLLYNAQCGFSGCSLLDGFSLTTYNLLWTAIPGLAMLLDRDRSVAMLMAQPKLYREAQAWKPSEGWWPGKKHYLSPKTFLRWTLRALWQSVTVLLVCAWGAGPSGSLAAASLHQGDLSFLVYSVMVIIQLVTVLADMRAPTLYNYALAAAAFLAYVLLQSARYSSLGQLLLWWVDTWWAGQGSGQVQAGSGESHQRPVTYPADTGSTAQFLTIVLAFAVAAGPWLLVSPCWRVQYQPSPHGMTEEGGTAQATEAVGATAEQITGSSLTIKATTGAGSALAASVREQGRVALGAMRHAASAVAAGDRRALKAALAVAGKAVQAVGRPGKADDDDDERAAPPTPDGTGLLGRAKSFVRGVRTLSTIPATPITPGTGAREARTTSEDMQGAVSSLGSRFEVATSPEIARLEFRGSPAPGTSTASATVHAGAHRRLSLEARRSDDNMDLPHNASSHFADRLDMNGVDEADEEGIDARAAAGRPLTAAQAEGEANTLGTASKQYSPKEAPLTRTTVPAPVPQQGGASARAQSSSAVGRAEQRRRDATEGLRKATERHDATSSVSGPGQPPAVPPHTGGAPQPAPTGQGEPSDSLNMLAGLLRALIERGHVCTGGMLLSHVLYDSCALSICSHPHVPVWCCVTHGLVEDSGTTCGTGAGAGTRTGVSPFLTARLGEVLSESILYAFADEYADALQGAAQAGGHALAQFSGFQYRLGEVVREGIRTVLGTLVESAGASAGQLLLADGGHESVVSTSAPALPTTSLTYPPHVPYTNPTAQGGSRASRDRSSTAGSRTSTGVPWWNRPRHGSDMGSSAVGTVVSSSGRERDREAERYGSWGRASGVGRGRSRLAGVVYRQGQGAGVVEDGLYGAGEMRLLASIPTALTCAASCLAMVGDVPRALWYTPSTAGAGVQAPAALLIPLQGTAGCVLALHGHGGGGMAELYDCLHGAGAQAPPHSRPLQALEALALTQALCSALSVVSGHSYSHASAGDAVISGSQSAAAAAAVSA